MLSDRDMDGPGDSHSDKFRSDLRICCCLFKKRFLQKLFFNHLNHLEKELILAIGLAIPGTASEKPESLILFPCVLPQLSSCFVCFGWSCCHKLVENLVERLSSWSKVCLFVCFWPGLVQVGWEPCSRIISCHLTSKVTYSRDQGVSLAFATLPENHLLASVVARPLTSPPPISPQTMSRPQQDCLQPAGGGEVILK